MSGLHYIVRDISEKKAQHCAAKDHCKNHQHKRNDDAYIDELFCGTAGVFFILASEVLACDYRAACRYCVKRGNDKNVDGIYKRNSGDRVFADGTYHYHVYDPHCYNEELLNYQRP